MACDGVKEARVDFASRSAIVIVAEDEADGEKLVAAVNEAGFGGTKVKQ